MKTKKAICLVIFLTFPIFTFSQQDNDSKEKYIEDLDFLQSTINNYYYALPLVEKRTNISINEDLNALKQLISDKTTITEFANIAHLSLTLLNDPHTRFASKQQIISGTRQSYYLRGPSNVQLSDTANVDFFNGIFSDSLFSSFQCWLWTRYDNGKYFNVQKIEVDSQTVEIGEEITHIHNIPINDFVNQNRLTMYNRFWDAQNKQWYDESFLFGAYKTGIEQYQLTIGGKNIELNAYNGFRILSDPPVRQNANPQIHRLGNNILYIYMPMMSNTQWYIDEFKRQYTPDTEKIILDIRGNPGGSDYLWQLFLSYIIDKPITYTYHNAFRNDESIIEGVRSFGEISNKGRDAYVMKQRTIEPDSSSARYDGKIYIIQNKFTASAASALSSVAMQEDKLVLIGEPSACISGYTFPALLFKLPNTGLVFNLAFSVDYSGGKENPYMDKVESDVPITFRDFMDRIFKYDIHSIDYLNNNDKAIQFIVND